MNRNEILLVLFFFLIKALISVEGLEENTKSSLYLTLSPNSSIHAAILCLPLSLFIHLSNDYPLWSSFGKANPPRSE